MASLITNPAVLEVIGSCDPSKGVAKRNKEAIHKAASSLVSHLGKLSEDQLKYVECLPKYLIEACRNASCADLERLIRLVESCVCISANEQLTWADELISNEFVFNCYYGFYFNESPGKVSHRVNCDMGANSLGIRFIVEEAHRLRLRSQCQQFIENSRKNDVISVLYQLGARPHTIKVLEELAGLECNYDALRRKWNMYGGCRARGNVSRSVPEHLIQAFSEAFWQRSQQGACIFESAAEAYDSVVDINNAPYKIDSFVASIEKDSLQFLQGQRELLGGFRATG